MSRRILIIAFLVCFPSILFSQKTLEITRINSAIEILPEYVSILCDSSNSLDINHISTPDFKGQFMCLENLKGNISNEFPYWLRLKIDLPDSDIEPTGIKFHRQIHVAEAYFLSDSIMQLKRTGFFMKPPVNEEIIPFSNILQISSNGNIEIYIKIRNIYDEYPVFELNLVAIKEEIKNNDRGLVFDAFVLGMMALMFFYGLFLFFQNKEKLYINYSLYIVFLATWYFTCFEFGYKITDSLPRQMYPYSDIPALLAYLFYIQFIREFINSREHLPKWDKILNTIRYVIFSFAIVLPIFMLISKRITIGYISLGIFSFFVSIFTGIFIIKLFRSKIQFSNILAFGSSFLIVGILYYSVYALVTKEYYFLAQKVGTLLELIVFTYGISVRYRAIEEEKQAVQASLIGQLEKNSSLQEKVNRELEEKVIERTSEIAEKNELLVEQNEEISAQRDMVMRQHNSITESIQYAQKIQTALLPPEDYIKQLLKESFILFLPKDVVSGDFYWMRKKNGTIYVVAADCTGHGVPGAFMSMLGISFLNDAIHRNEVSQVNNVLNELRRQVKFSLHQTGKQGEAKDGMDLAFVAINIEEKLLQYSGAFNPLYIIRNKEIIEIKADKMPIGIHPLEQNSFTNHEIKLQPKDHIYLFSDGYIDQLGGPDNKTFRSHRFRKLLLEIHDQSLADQKTILHKRFESWRNKSEQTDDILVIGIKI